MRFTENGIDASGNLIITRNIAAITVDGVDGFALSNFHFVGIDSCTILRKLSVIWQVAKFVFGK